MANPIPENVQQVLSSLNSQQQVTLRAYIASLREEIKELESKSLAATDPDPHAHYHGHEKCTSDHGHADNEHKDDHHEDQAHSHGHGDDGDCTMDHGHDDHSDGHSHHDHHGLDHKKEEPKDHHEHGHDHHKEEDTQMPAWKKKALESGSGDPMAAPFGGTWNTEASVSATDETK